MSTSGALGALCSSGGILQKQAFITNGISGPYAILRQWSSLAYTFLLLIGKQNHWYGLRPIQILGSNRKPPSALHAAKLTDKFRVRTGTVSSCDFLLYSIGGSLPVQKPLHKRADTGSSTGGRLC